MIEPKKIEEIAFQDPVFDADKLVERLRVRQCNFWYEGKLRYGVTLNMVLDCLLQARTDDDSFIKVSPRALREKLKKLLGTRGEKPEPEPEAEIEIQFHADADHSFQMDQTHVLALFSSKEDLQKHLECGALQHAELYRRNITHDGTLTAIFTSENYIASFIERFIYYITENYQIQEWFLAGNDAPVLGLATTGQCLSVAPIVCKIHSLEEEI